MNRIPALLAMCAGLVAIFMRLYRTALTIDKEKK